MISLACLDMAGTTVSDGGLVEASFTAAMTSQGVDEASHRFQEGLAYVRRTMGLSKIVVFRHLFDDDEATAQAANEAFEQAYDDAVRNGGVSPLPGAEDAIDALRDGGVRVCLTTGFSAGTRDAIVDALGWRDRVDLLLAPSEAGRGRPYPDMVLAAVLRLEVDSVADVAVAGDTANDLWSGTRAGASVVAGVLTGAHDRVQLAEAPHTHILDSIADLPPLLLETA
jgi:phosphoglycolate phosphatase